MASTTNAILRASRPMFSQTLRSSTTSGSSAFARAGRQQFTGFRFQQGGRRWQSTGDAAGNAGQQQQQGQQGQQANWFKKMWESEVGFKTVHFWAPVMKWSLVLAGISDFARPAEKLSFTQNFALTCTGLIWTRWCMVIKPKNYLLAAVNFFLALVGIGQISRIAMHESSKKAAVADVKADVEEHAKAVKDAVKSS